MQVVVLYTGYQSFSLFISQDCKYLDLGIYQKYQLGVEDASRFVHKQLIPHTHYLHHDLHSHGSHSLLERWQRLSS